MLGISLTEWIGYLASVLVLVSYMVKKIRLLRIISIFGCLFFITYGIMLDYKIPIIVTNVSIMGINLYFLFFKKEKK